VGIAENLAMALLAPKGHSQEEMLEEVKEATNEQEVQQQAELALDGLSSACQAAKQIEATIFRSCFRHHLG
jgi:hypothetical protein